MKRPLGTILFVLINFLIHSSFAGTNSTVILGGVTITPSINEGDIATLRGNVGDLVLSQNDRFLNHLFLTLLGRSIEPLELDTYSSALARGTSPQQLAS